MSPVQSNIHFNSDSIKNPFSCLSPEKDDSLEFNGTVSAFPFDTGSSLCNESRLNESRTYESRLNESRT